MSGSYTVCLSVAPDEAVLPSELLGSLANQVQGLCGEGWLPAGGVTYVPGSRPMVMQAMYRRTAQEGPAIALAN